MSSAPSIEPTDVPPAAATPEVQVPAGPANVKPATGWEFYRTQFALLAGFSVPPETKARFEARAAQIFHSRCESLRDQVLVGSPSVIFMLKNLQEIHAEMGIDKIMCSPCNEQRAGGFMPGSGVLLCENRIMGFGMMEDTLTHELIHAYDHQRFEVDWMNMRHHACSEIRASSLSGECRWWREFKKYGFGDFVKHHQACVKRRATLSVMAHPHCEDKEHAEMVVNQVFDSCFADTRPFDEIYR
ncbi:Mitochondrial inner membrane protease atp23 [Saitoella coloradoensis]